MHLRTLSSQMVDGMFLLRVSQRSGMQLVISVWYKTECKHFKIFHVKVCVYMCVREREREYMYPRATCKHTH